MSDTGRSEEQLYSAVVQNNKHVDKSSSNWRQHFNDRTLGPKISIENPGMLPVSNNQSVCLSLILLVIRMYWNIKYLHECFCLSIVVSVGTEETFSTQVLPQFSC